jgi:hypothetical protein
LQTLQGMFSTCPAMFVARRTGSYDAVLRFLELSVSRTFPVACAGTAEHRGLMVSQ